MENPPIERPFPLPLRDDFSIQDRFGAGAGHDAAPPICRICRGEGTSNEPLFYPCKCSGSIKFVHQDCLMEWLSHSQKKYCELCKTPFRFTKLYAPDMPQSLPVHIFVEHMAKYIFRHVLVWLRAAMAISVWIFWLPYFMRAVWSFMFWISDEGLGSASDLARSHNVTSSTPTMPTSILDVGSCPTSPLLAVPTTSVAQVHAVMSQLAPEDFSDYLVRIFLGSFGVPTTVNHSDPTVAPNHNTSLELKSAIVANSSSLLSNLAVLKTMTRSPTLNRAIVSVLEGQVITVLIIISFILVILVRDYVVQQQPEINMRAAFAGGENDGAVPDQDIDDMVQRRPFLEDTDDSTTDDETLDDGNQTDDQDWPVRDMEEPQSQLEPVLDPDSTADRPGHPMPDRPRDSFQVPPEAAAAASQSDGSRALTGERASVIDYLRIYRRADGNLEEILRIVEEEGLQDKLSYWVDVTRRSLRDHQQQNDAKQVANTSDDVPISGQDQIAASASDELALLRPSSPATGSEGKGKGRALLPSPPHPDFPAASTGPQQQHPGNPLANNTWTFASLDDDDANQLEGQSSVTEPSAPFYHAPEEGSSSSGGAHPPVVADARASDLADAVPRLADAHAIAQASTHGDDPDQDLHNAPDHEENDGGNHNDNGDDEDVSIVGRVTNFMWGDLDEPQPPDDLVEDPAPAANADNELLWDDHVAAAVAEQPAGAGAGAGAAAAAVAAVAAAAVDDEDDDEEDVAGAAGFAAANGGFDAEEVEDMEDFEGVMELIGMRGPIAGLFQNAIFCAVLVSVTIFLCIFLPYNIGRIAVWILASPTRLVRMLFELSKLTQDAAVLLGGMSSWFALNILDMLTKCIGGPLAAQVASARSMSWALWTNAGSRILDCVFLDFPMTASEVQNFSAISHDALNTVKSNISSIFVSTCSAMEALRNSRFDGFSAGTTAVLSSLSSSLESFSSWLMNPSTWVISLGQVEERPLIDPDLAHWSSLDRFWAILAGYVSMCLLSALYLQRDGPFSRGTVMHAWEAGVIDFLQQASGIMKVILIISIEMLVFPLYCGLLLDAALLPLFEGATFGSRFSFTLNYPMTSVFVHWFVGTGYMFHFALFVSMCRKIMRPGVLYFIRDPDDPEFHPVRDVLERNLTTQLRKILFSAFVYGALVIVCLGGVVWGLSFAMPDVLPIHYSSNEPILEFPVDLLFYNFLMPLAVKFFKPSDALHTMYTWWFRQCARSLRLTYFLFGERRIDEEGTLKLPSSSPHRASPTGLLLEVDETNTVIPKTWRDTFEGGDAKPNPPTSREQRRDLRRKKSQLVHSGQLVVSGQFVRAPASDRVKIPPGQKVFLSVNERGSRQDGQADVGLYASDQYQQVYVPSNFRSRIFVFIVSIWVFAAVTGVGFTIIPLVFGRRVFKALIPEHIRTNDIYAFSIGIFSLGTLVYSGFYLRSMMHKARRWANDARREVVNGSMVKRISTACVHAGKLVYAYFFLLIVFPLLASTMLELYLTIPLHTWMYPPTALSTEKDARVDRHTMRVIQSWTLGLLYLKLATRTMASMFPDSRAANAMRSIMRRGWLRPDVGLLTRAFIVPGLAAAAVAILAPPAVTYALVNRGILTGSGDGAEEATDSLKLVMMYRQSYPAAAFTALLAKNVVTLVNALDHWTAGVRDEAYLIGERLHNFGAGAGVRKGRRMWGGGRQRL